MKEVARPLTMSLLPPANDGVS